MESDRKKQLIDVFLDTMSRTENDPLLKESVAKSIAGQRMIRAEDDIELPVGGAFAATQIVVSGDRTLQAASKYAGHRVCVLNFASATTPGGGVTKGASAQEECLCRESTLYKCLVSELGMGSFYGPHRKDGNPLHNDDILYTPDVAVIKDWRHRPLAEPFYVDVITCAAPNLRWNPSNRYNVDDGTAVAISDTELYEIHLSRARKIIASAAANGCDVLILGAFGCGVFRNDPYVVARAYNRALSEFYGWFDTVEFAVYCNEWNKVNFTAFASSMHTK